MAEPGGVFSVPQTAVGLYLIAAVVAFASGVNPVMAAAVALPVGLLYAGYTTLEP